MTPSTTNGPLPEGGETALRSTNPFTVEAVTTHTPATAYEKVLAYAGASLVRDKIDERIMEEVRTGTCGKDGVNGSQYGLIDTQTDREGFITYNSLPKENHTNGIDNDWAAAHIPEGKTYKDFDPNTGYTYIELYINSLIEDFMKACCEGGSDSPSTHDF